MNKRIFFLLAAVVLVSIITGAFVLQYIFSSKENANIVIPKGDQNAVTPKVYFGVDIAYGNLTAVEAQIDQMSSYINLVIIGSTRITYSSQLDSVCQNIYDKGLYFILYTERSPQLQWLQNAINKWGNHFLGLYAFDELGGKQIDQYEDQVAVTHASNYTNAANQYNNILGSVLSRIRGYYGNSTDVALFTSDYALYWFDYKAGYSTVFAEFAWNDSRRLNLALVRGAASVQGKDWGIMITWTYNQPPYLESGSQLTSDMEFAYNSGAKYIIVFDSNTDYTSGTLKPEHLQAMQQFWQYMQANPKPSDSFSRAAFVLPNDYGYGFRGSDDKLWGIWQANDSRMQLYENLNNVLQKYGGKLDIVYDDATFPKYGGIYETLIFWNGTAIGG